MFCLWIWILVFWLSFVGCISQHHQGFQSWFPIKICRVFLIAQLSLQAKHTSASPWSWDSMAFGYLKAASLFLLSLPAKGQLYDPIFQWTKYRYGVVKLKCLPWHANQMTCQSQFFSLNSFSNWWNYSVSSKSFGSFSAKSQNLYKSAWQLRKVAVKIQRQTWWVIRYLRHDSDLGQLLALCY